MESNVEADGRERRSIKDGPGQSKIASAAISDPFILLRQEDGAVSLLKGDTMEGKLIPVESDMVWPEFSRRYETLLSFAISSRPVLVHPSSQMLLESCVARFLSA